MSQKSLHLEISKFVRYHLGKDCFAPLTGQDHPAWCSFVYALQCYAHGGGDEAIAAMRAAVLCTQRTDSVLCVFVQAIPGVLEWTSVATLWPRIAGDVALRDANGRPATYLCAIERHEVVRSEGGRKPQVEVTQTAWGVRRPVVAAAGATP